MGFGLPAAIGVQMAHPKAEVAVVTGESSIQMCIQELATCLQYDLPIKIILLNNGYMGMVRQWQEFFYEKRYAMSYFDALPDFVKLADAYLLLHKAYSAVVEAQTSGRRLLGNYFKVAFYGAVSARSLSLLD